MSSSSNSDVLGLGRLSNSSDLFLDIQCFISPPSSFVVTGFFITNILVLLPLCIFILHHGLKQHQQRQSSMNHNDCLTYHMVTIELIGVSGCFLMCCGIHTDHVNLFMVGFYCYSFTCFGQIFFHLLTCLDRYLAVVHPVLYLTLKSDRGIQIRNASMACAYLISCIMTCLMKEKIYMNLNFSILTLSLLIVSFCSISVLCVLIRPSAAKQAIGKKRADQSKLRAFCTIMVILGVLLVRFTLSLFWSIVFVTEKIFDCVVMTFDVWFNLPTSLVLPLLYIHKEHK